MGDVLTAIPHRVKYLLKLGLLTELKCNVKGDTFLNLLRTSLYLNLLEVLLRMSKCEGQTDFFCIWLLFTLIGILLLLTEFNVLDELSYGHTFCWWSVFKVTTG